MRLHPDAKQWHRLWSMRWIIATTVFSSITAAYLTLPPDWLPAIPDGVRKFLALGTIVTAAGAGVARVLAQPPLNPPGDPR